MSLKSGCPIPLIPQPNRVFEFNIKRRTILRDKKVYILQDGEYPQTMAELDTYVVTIVQFNLLNVFNPRCWNNLTTEDICMLIQKYIPARSLHLLAYFYEIEFIQQFIKPPSMGSFYMEVDKQDKTLRTKLFAAIGRHTSSASSTTTMTRKCNVLSMKKLAKLNILFPIPIHTISVEQIHQIWKTVLNVDNNNNNNSKLILNGIASRTFSAAYSWNNRLFVPFKHAYAQIASNMFVYIFVNVEPKNEYIDKWGPAICPLQEPFVWKLTTQSNVEYVESYETIGFSTTTNPFGSFL